MKSDLIRKIEKETRDKYEGGIYKPESICVLPSEDATNFAEVLLYLKFALLKRHLSPFPVLDLCCGSGLHLMELSRDITAGIGLDFSRAFIEKANSIRTDNRLEDISFVQGDATQLPFGQDYFGTVYSFSSLYNIPRMDEAIAEVARVLIPNGKCIIELGNVYSLNTLVCHSYPEIAFPCLISVGRMKTLLRKAGLDILEHLAFQTLPMWGNRPKWLAPLMGRWVIRIMQTKIRGKMIDEWISNLPLFRHFAFRHIFVCQKRVAG